MPVGWVAPISAQFSATPTRPASLPPMPTVTSVVSRRSPLNWGGLVPPAGRSVWGWVMCLVWALPQLTSVNVAVRSAGAVSDG